MSDVRSRTRDCLIAVLACCVAATRVQGEQPKAGEAGLRWQVLSPVPDSRGVAGAFAGISADRLLVAGGANFPEGAPWEGGQKAWYDRVWTIDAPRATWQQVGRLPRPLAYGVSVTTAGGVACVGGSDSQRHYADCFLLSLQKGSLRRRPLPQLPRPVANACGAVLGDTLYIAGGSESPSSVEALGSFYALDLASPTAAWKSLDSWPGPPRMLAVAAVQDGSFFLISGVELSAAEDGSPKRRYLTDAYRYRPGGGWSRLADLPRAAAGAPSPSPAIGPSQFLILGGDDGANVGFQPPQSHPGFATGVLAYNAVTDVWAGVGRTPAPSVTAPMVRWDDAWVLVSGERRPGVRSPETWALRAESRRTRFGLWNYAALGLYPIIMLAVAWAVGTQRTSDEFFRSGQRIPWWAAGMSIYATMLSSITFMAVPAKSFVADWSFLLANASVLLLAPIIVAYYLPFFRQLNVTSAYEYLELRFNLAIRWFASAAFIALQLGRTAIVLYLPALALATVSNIEIHACIAIMGVLCILMTFQGGLESVVWTDVAQTIILLAGAIATLVAAVASIPGGAAEIWSIAQADDKLFGALRWTPELTAATGWVILLGNLFITLSSYTAGQDIVQRYISTPDARQAAQAIWTNAIMVLPSSLLFFSVGTALYAFYKIHPANLDPTLQNDAVFPQFIVNELPVGLGGLVVAGIFAAAQPTSSLNGIATAWVNDFHVRLRPAMSDARRLRVAQLVTIGSGLLGTAIALIMAKYNIASAWDAFLGMLALAGSTLAGLFALGIFSRRAHGRGAIVGAVVSVAALAYARITALHFFTYGAIGFLTCCGVGWAASLVIPARSKNLAGLTIHTRRAVREEPSL
ncbi:MAG: sodium:solute symporter [Planctomycetota bacterium]|nr:MAG: sodium:solute symporter [Planctomycetota bacterium]